MCKFSANAYSILSAFSLLLSLDTIVMQGKLTELPTTVTATLEGDKTWTFLFSAASPISTFTPMAFLIVAFAMLN